MFAKVASLQPVLKWKAFPEARDLAADEQGRLKDIGPVRYDLRIWAVTADGSWIMRVYEREGLPQPEHRLEKPLVGMTRYSWTVRASFELNGRTRVTPWSFCSWPAPPASWHSAQRIEETTPASYFSFQTP
jgi:hypothetical protein